MRAVLDANVLIAALLSRHGAPGQLLASWLAGDFELVLSDGLLAELGRALAYPKLDKRIPPSEAHAFVALLRSAGDLVPDVEEPPSRSADPGDDYLIALAATAGAALVTGDHHLLEFEGLPIHSPRAFLDLLLSR